MPECIWAGSSDTSDIRITSHCRAGRGNRTGVEITDKETGRRPGLHTNAKIFTFCFSAFLPAGAALVSRPVPAGQRLLQRTPGLETHRRPGCPYVGTESAGGGAAA